MHHCCSKACGCEGQLQVGKGRSRNYAMVLIDKSHGNHTVWPAMHVSLSSADLLECIELNQVRSERIISHLAMVAIVFDSAARYFLSAPSAGWIELDTMCFKCFSRRMQSGSDRWSTATLNMSWRMPWRWKIIRWETLGQDCSVARGQSFVKLSFICGLKSYSALSPEGMISWLIACTSITKK